MHLRFKQDKTVLKKNWHELPTAWFLRGSPLKSILRCSDKHFIYKKIGFVQQSFTQFSTDKTKRVKYDTHLDINANILQILIN